jgi:hypothetical protein
MKKEHLILLIAGVILVCLIKAGKKSSNYSEFIKPGDKGNDVYGLQSALTSITGLKFANMGAYDTDTLNAVRYYMNGTGSLIDYDKGYVSRDFATDLFLIQNKINK